jgi:hypothetical protein
MDKLNQQLLALSKKLHIDLKAILDVLSRLRKDFEGQTQAISAYTNTQQEQRNAKTVVETELRTPVPISVQAETKERDSNWKKVKTSAEILGIVGALAYAFIAYQTWKEVMRQTDQTAIATRQARGDAARQLLFAEYQLRTDERPWLAQEFMKQSMPVNVDGLAIANLAIRDVGKTQAVRVRAKASVVVITSDTKRIPFDSATEVGVNPTVIYPSSDPAIYGIPVVRRLPNGLWGGVTWTEITPALHVDDAFLFGFGSISYRDVFGLSTHVQTFCVMLVGGFRPTRVRQPLSGATLRQQCAEYNTAYDDR